MKLCFPSQEFDAAVAAICHGSVSDEPTRAMNELLRNHPAARDEYLLRVELHSRLASDLDLFALSTSAGVPSGGIHDLSQEVAPLRSSWFPKNDPSMIRNFSGAMDEFCLFTLPAAEIHALYLSDKSPRGQAAAPDRKLPFYRRAVPPFQQSPDEYQTIPPQPLFDCSLPALPGPGHAAGR